MEPLDLARSAEAHFRATTISYPVWLKRVQNGYKGKPYPTEGTEWGKGLADMTALQAALAATTPPVTGNVLWRADGTTGTDPAYIIEQEWSAISDDSAGGSAAISAPFSHANIGLTSGTGDVLTGKRSYHVTVPAGEGRHELKMAHPVRTGWDSRQFTEGMETWVSWAVKVVDYAHPPASGDFWIVDQFRHTGDTGMPSGGSPHALGMKNGYSNWMWFSDQNIYTNALWEYNMGVPIVEGQVLKITFHAKWSTNSATGFLEVFLNNGSGWVTGFPKRMQQTLLVNPSTSQPGRAHMRFGTYRGDTYAGTGDTYMAGLVCATTRAKAESVAFGT